MYCAARRNNQSTAGSVGQKAYLASKRVSVIGTSSPRSAAFKRVPRRIEPWFIAPSCEVPPLIRASRSAHLPFADPEFGDCVTLPNNRDQRQSRSSRSYSAPLMNRLYTMSDRPSPPPAICANCQGKTNAAYRYCPAGEGAAFGVSLGPSRQMAVAAK